MIETQVSNKHKPHVSALAASTLTNVREENEVEYCDNTKVSNSTVVSITSGPEPSQLHLLAINGNKLELQELLKSGKWDVNRIDHMGRTPLIYSVLGDRIDCVLILLKAGADINQTDIDRRTALHWAAYQGDHKLVRVLLSKDADIIVRDKEGRTALHLSTSHNNVKVLQALLQSMNKDDIDTPDNKGMSALCWSVFYERVDYVKLLLKYGSLASCLDGESRCVLHWTSENKDTAVIKLLYEGNGTLINWPDREKRTVLHLSVGQSNYKLVTFLLSLPETNINVTDGFERTPLHWAAVLKDTTMVKLLLNNGANHSIVDKNGVSTLHYAVQHEDSFDTVKVFVENGVQDKPDKEQGTALMWAAVKGHDKTVELLLQKSISNVNAVDIHGQTSLHLAVQAGHLACVKILIANGANVEKLDGKHHIPLFYACASGHIDIVHELLNHGSSSKLNDRDLEGRSPLHYAAMVDRTDIIKTLIQSKLDPNIQDSAGRAPLHFAAYGGFVHCMNVLLENNANVNIQDYGGCTALHWASRSGSLGAVKLLVSRYKADVNIFEKSLEEFTPLDYAVLEDHQDVAFYLTENKGLTISSIRELSATKIKAVWKGYKFRKEFNETREHYLKHERIRKAASDNDISTLNESTSTIIPYSQNMLNIAKIKINSRSLNDVGTTVNDENVPLTFSPKFIDSNLSPELSFLRKKSLSDTSAVSHSSRSSYQHGDKTNRGPKFSVPSNNPMSLRKRSTGGSSISYSLRPIFYETRSRSNIQRNMSMPKRSIGGSSIGRSPRPSVDETRLSTNKAKKESTCSSTFTERNLFLYPDSYKKQNSDQVFFKESNLPSWMSKSVQSVYKATKVSSETFYRQSPISSSGSSDIAGNSARKLYANHNNNFTSSYSRHIQEASNSTSSSTEKRQFCSVKPLTSVLPVLIHKPTKLKTTNHESKSNTIITSSDLPSNKVLFPSSESDKPWQLFRRDQKRINIIRQKTEAAVKIQRMFRKYQNNTNKIDAGREFVATKSILGHSNNEVNEFYENKIESCASSDEMEDDEEGLQEVAALVIQLAWRQYVKNKLVSENDMEATREQHIIEDTLKFNSKEPSLIEESEESGFQLSLESDGLDSSFEENKLRTMMGASKKKLSATTSLPFAQNSYGDVTTKKRSRRFSLKKKLLQHSNSQSKESNNVLSPKTNGEISTLSLVQSLNKNEINAIKSGKPKLFLRAKSLKS